MSPGAAKKAAAPPPKPYRPPTVREVGAQDWANGKAQVKQVILGQKDSGKTRFASAYPRPIYLATEPTVGASIAGRKIAYEKGIGAPHLVDIEGSEQMIDVLRWLSDLTKPPKKAPGGRARYETAILDTADGLSRLIKAEWCLANNAAAFEGREAWSYLESRTGLILTRLTALDMHVLVLCHLKDYEVDVVGRDGKKEKETRYGPQLQGQFKDNIFNDFDLVGRIETQPINREGIRVSQRGITYESTPQYDFLTDHFYLSPPGDKALGDKFWPITMDDGTKGGTGTPESFEQQNFGALMHALLDGAEDTGEGGVVETIERPVADVAPADQAGGPVASAAPAPGGRAVPAPAAATPPPAQVPAQAPAPAAEVPAPDAGAAVDPGDVGSVQQPQAPETVEPVADQTTGEIAQDQPLPAEVPANTTPAPVGTVAPVVEQQPVPEAVPADVVVETAPETVVPETADGAEAAPAAAEPVASPVEGAEAHDHAVAAVTEGLGGEVVSTGTGADTEKEGHCPVCGKSMEKESADLVQLSRLKHKPLVLPNGSTLYERGGCCYVCYSDLNAMKAAADAEAVKAGTYFDPALIGSTAT